MFTVNYYPKLVLNFVSFSGLSGVYTVFIFTKWIKFDHAAHLGGILLGICYAYFGYPNRTLIMVW